MAKPLSANKKEGNADGGSQTARVTTVVWALLMRWCGAVGTKIGKASGEKRRQRGGREAGARRPASAVDDRGGERLSACSVPGGPGLRGLSRCGAFCGEPGEAWAELVGFPAVPDTLRPLPQLG